MKKGEDGGRPHRASTTSVTRGGSKINKRKEDTGRRRKRHRAMHLTTACTLRRKLRRRWRFRRSALPTGPLVLRLWLSLLAFYVVSFKLVCLVMAILGFGLVIGLPFLQ